MLICFYPKSNDYQLLSNQKVVILESTSTQYKYSILWPILEKFTKISKNLKYFNWNLKKNNLEK